jgi:nicotinamidase-related amidase
MLERNDTALLVVDIQGRLARIMHRKEALFDNLIKVIEGCKTLAVPIVWAEQNPDGLGPTIPEIAQHLSGCTPLPKMSFSCMGCDAIAGALSALGRRQVLIAGIETHICVYQTVCDLRKAGYVPHVVSDAVSSRTPENRAIGIERCRDAGASITSVEMALFELLKVAEGDEFKALLRIVK